MKKIILLLIMFFAFSCNAETLKGGVVDEYIPNGFFGSWGVISKLQSTTDTNMFKMEARDIWMLSGYGNVLVLENLESGARSEMILKNKSQDKKSLKFERSKTIKENETQKIIQREEIEFVLDGDKFSGVDEYIVEKYKDNVRIKKDVGRYKLSGVRISGTSPTNY